MRSITIVSANFSSHFGARHGVTQRGAETFSGFPADSDLEPRMLHRYEDEDEDVCPFDMAEYVIKRPVEQRILVVEDHQRVADHIGRGLRESGFVVNLCSSGEDALERVLHQSYDAMTLDIMLPGRDGLSVLTTLREKGFLIPIIIVSARGRVTDRTAGLDLGADDYLAKPFQIEELVSRVRALIRRSSGVFLNLLRAGDLTMNLVSREVHRGKRRLDLTSREFGLLEFFMRSPDEICSRSKISSHVWQMHFHSGTNLVDVTLGRLRRKVDRVGEDKMFETVRGVGYRLVCHSDGRSSHTAT